MSALQFDVFANSDPDTSDTHPYFVVLQDDGLKHLNTRIVAPLVSPKRLPHFERLMPEVTIAKMRYVIDMTNIGTIPTRILADRVGSFETERYRIVGALDLVFTGV